MRLSDIQQQHILQAIRQNFGADAKVWLFGSHVDDTRRGGDVNLYVETTQSNAACHERLVFFCAEAYGLGSSPT
ncbi:MAG: nucleotidyltransferase domain-containing protein [Chlorobium sp.]